MPTTSGAFTKLRNAVIIFIMPVFIFVSPSFRSSVSVSAVRKETTLPPLDGLS